MALLLISGGGWIRTTDLQVMSLTSYHCYHPACMTLCIKDLICASGRTRTCNLLVRSEILFPIELPKHWSGISWSRTIFSGFSVLRIHQVCQDSNVRKQKDSNLRNPCGVRPLSRGLVSTAHPCFHFGQSQRTSNIIF